MFRCYFLICAILSARVCCNECPRLVSDISQDSCTARSQNDDSFFYGLEEGNCVPRCKSYASERHKSCANDQKCMPGYVCQYRCGPDDDLKQTPCETDQDCIIAASNDSAVCEEYCVAKDEESCMAYHINTPDYRDTYWKALRFKPSCKNDGTWQAKQCKGGLNGRCFCFDPTGKRLFGEALFSKAENMTCACSRRQSELDAFRITTLHCDSMGNYESLQCDKVSKQCWCADPTTGDLLSAVVPEKAMELLLPCFSEHTYGSQYLRQCESKKLAQTLIMTKLRNHGVTYATEDFLLCDNDGSYGAFTIERDNAYCTWRDNSKIGSWQTNIQNGYLDLNCHCARDFYRYGSSQICLATGNYKPLQQNSESSYCVDSDGFAKSDILTDLNSDVQDSYCDQYY